MKLVISRHLSMQIKYAFPRGGTVYWQRKIPRDLADRYPSAGTLKLNLHTQDPKVIAVKVAKLNRKHEAIWEAMRNDPTLTPKSVIEEAQALLKRHGLGVNGRGADEAALDYFIEGLESKRAQWAQTQPEPEEAYREGSTGAAARAGVLYADSVSSSNL